MEFLCAIDKPMKTTLGIPCSYSWWKIINLPNKLWKNPHMKQFQSPQNSNKTPSFPMQSINQSKIVFSLQFSSCSHSIAPPSKMTFPDVYFKAKELEEENLQQISWKLWLFSPMFLKIWAVVVAYFSQLSTSLPFHSFHYSTFKADYIAPRQTVKQETYMSCLSLSFTSLFFSLLHPSIFFWP